MSEHSATVYAPDGKPYKACKDCRHATPLKRRFLWSTWDDWRNGWCDAIASMNIIDGTITRCEPIWAARLKVDSLCNKEGKLWEARIAAHDLPLIDGKE